MSDRSNLRVGVYVDVENLMRTGGRGLRFETLRRFACREGGEAIRLNAYLAYDERRAVHDLDYRTRATRYHFALRDVGFKVIEKPVRWYTSEDGVCTSKANSDLDLAVDMLLQSAKLDKVVLVSGDGDFVQVVRALQNMGCRVELVGCQNVSYDLRCEADLFVSGFLIPELLPQPVKAPSWGLVGSIVRGTCHHYNAEKGFGFLRYLAAVERTNVCDAFFHCSQCPDDLRLDWLPSRDLIFEFTLQPGRSQPASGEVRLEAKDLRLVANYGSFGPKFNRQEPKAPIVPGDTLFEPTDLTPADGEDGDVVRFGS